MGCIILIPMPNAPIGLCFHDSNIYGIPTQTTIVRKLMKNLVKMLLHKNWNNMLQQTWFQPILPKTSYSISDENFSNEKKFCYQILQLKMTEPKIFSFRSQGINFRLNNTEGSKKSPERSRQLLQGRDDTMKKERGSFSPFEFFSFEDMRPS